MNDKKILRGFSALADIDINAITQPQSKERPNLMPKVKNISKRRGTMTKNDLRNYLKDK